MSFRQDLAYACRTLRGHPLFTLTAVLSVAVGIAGATSVFSVADAMLLRSSPGVASPHRLIEVGRIEPDGDFNTLSYADYVDLRDRNAVLEGLAAVDGGAVFGVGTSAGAISVDGAHVAANYFAVLGVPFTLGRGFADHEERTSTQAAVAVISERIWDRLFNGEMDVVGRTLHLSGRPYSIVGVAGAGFAGTTLTVEDVWLPLAGYSDALMQPDRTPLQAIGRPRPDVTLDVAQAHMQQLARELPRGQAGTDPLRVALVPSDRIPESEQNAVETFIGLLFAMVGLLLLIACTNVAGMLGARGLARKREMAVRVALGAAHGRVVRLLVAESLVIGAAGALAGIGGAFALTQALRGIVPVLPLSISLDFGVDWRVIGFAVALSLIASLVFGLLPAVQAARVDLQSAMKPDRSGGGPRRLRLRQAFVVAQVAVSVLLVVCAVLLARSVSHAAGVDPGFAAENVDLVGINMRLGGYDDGADVVFAEELIAEVERLPGVTAAGTAWIVPLQMRGTSTTVSLPATGTEESRLTTLWNVVSPGYFEALGLPMVRGRAFTERDRAGAPEVAIVSETFAERAWPGEDPIGRSFVNRDRTMQVVGVARDSKYRSIGEAPQPFLYRPLSQEHQNELALLIRRSGPSVIPAVRALLQQMDPNLPILRATTVADATAFSLFPRRLAMWTAVSAGIVGLFLASLGLYGVTAYDVTRRTREIGIRLAVGATPARVLRMVLRRAMQLAGTGALLGLIAAAGISQVLTIVLFRVEPLDPISFVSGAVLLAMVALAASLIPARRAAAADPVAALRAE